MTLLSGGLEHLATGLAIYVLPFLVVLTVLVFVHELGHYLLARLNGVKVEVFSIGFGPELAGRHDRSGTRWRISAIPFGGYVKMFGDADAASTPGEALPQMSAEERSVSFHYKGLGARAAILAAGPFANFLFAVVVYAGIYMTVGQPFTPPEVGQVMKGSAAAAAGIEPGDVFVSIDGSKVGSFEDLQQAVRLNTGTPMHMVIARAGKDIPVEITPKITNQVDRFGNHYRFGMLGVIHSGYHYIRRGPVTAMGAACGETWRMVTTILDGVGQMITGVRAADEIGGPIGIARLSGEVAQGGLLPVLEFMAMLSVNLGLINLFPIPVLDGGHLLFYAAEALMGRPLGRRVQEYGFRLGLALVLTLMVFATWNDLVRIGVVPFLKSLLT